MRPPLAPGGTSSGGSLPGRAFAKGTWRAAAGHEGGVDVDDVHVPVATRGSSGGGSGQVVGGGFGFGGAGAYGSPVPIMPRQRMVVSEGGFAPPAASAASSGAAAASGSDEDDEDGGGGGRDSRTEGGAPVGADGGLAGERRKRTRRRRKPSIGGASGGERQSVLSEAGADLNLRGSVGGEGGGGDGLCQVSQVPPGGSPGGGGGGCRRGSDGGGHLHVSSLLGEGGEKPPLPAAKKSAGKKDYASWAAATPEYRAEAKSAAQPSPKATNEHVKGLVAEHARYSGGGDGASAGSGGGEPNSPPRFSRVSTDALPAPSSLSGPHLPPAPGSSHPHHPPGAGATSVLISRGPDGSTGFGAGRGKPMAPPI